MSTKRYQWAAPGDVNAFFGLMLDNVADLLLAVGLLAGIFKFPTSFALRYMVPGTAIGVMVGDLIFFWMALRLARMIGRNDVTAMPLGLDTPSTFGMVIFVLGPAFLEGKRRFGIDQLAAPSEELLIQAATYAWHVGICTIVISGLFKFACAIVSGWVRRVVPRAGLLGSLTAVALVLITFMPLMEILRFPTVGLLAMAVILTTLVARVRLPGRIPGALGALLIAGLVYYAMDWTGTLGQAAAKPEFNPSEALLPTGWLSVFGFEWVGALRDSFRYLPVVIPFALATVVGGIDCTESAAAAGDEYHTGSIIAIESLATLVAGMCGGVIQTTPYIGHPAYKAMGGRAAYTLATAIFIGSVGVLGYFGYLYLLIPKAAIFPILVFIGLEITAQSFRATPVRHYAAVAIACVPAMAALVLIFVDNLQGQYADVVGGLNESLAQYRQLGEQELQSAQGRQLLRDVSDHAVTLEQIAGNPKKGLVAQPRFRLGEDLQTLRMLSGGFIVTSLIWASFLASLIDRRLALAAGYFGVAAMCSLFGVIHSPLPGSPLVNPWNLPDTLPHAAAGQTPIYLASAYAGIAVLMLVWAWWMRWSGDTYPPSHLEEENV